MLTEEQAQRILQKEIGFHTSRSGGKGGQNVNKVETKVELEFDVNTSRVLNDDQKKTIFKKYPDFIEGSLIRIIGNSHRTQTSEQRAAQKKLILLLNKLLKPIKKRVPTKPGKASKQKKLDNKKRQGEKKSLRQKIR